MRRVQHFLFLLLLLPSCASALRGPDQYFAVTTDPPGATVLYRDSEYLSPVILKLPRDKDASLLVRKTGHKESFVHFDQKGDGALMWNCSLLPLAPAGCCIDIAAGSSHHLEEQSLHIDLPLEPLPGQGAQPVQAWEPSERERWEAGIARMKELERQRDDHYSAGSFLFPIGLALTFASWANLQNVREECCPKGDTDCRRDREAELNRKALWTVLSGAVTVAGMGFFVSASNADTEESQLVKELNATNPANHVREPAPVKETYKPNFIQMRMRTEW